MQSPRQALRHGIALIPENRQEEGLFLDLRVVANVSIASLPKILWSRVLRLLSRRKERALARRAATAVNIAPETVSRVARVLSGGNQQKVLFARWLMRGCDVLVMIEPTRGVDVGARIEIYRQIERLAQGGAGIVVVSTDVPEVLALADRIVALYEGAVAAVFDPRTATEPQVSLAMQGGHPSPGVLEPAPVQR